MAQTNHIDLIEFSTASTEALAATKQFFGSVFGWQFQSWGDDYADTKDSGMSSGLIADPDAMALKPLAVIHVDDLEMARQRVVDAGGNITKEIFSFPGGRRFHFTEPSGNELAAWSK